LGGGIGGLLNLNTAGQNYAYLYDGKGNVEAVLDAAQNVVAAFRYDPFGVLLNQTGSLKQAYGFSTKRTDPRTGIVFYQYRPYGPGSGRWFTRDPLGEAGGMNLYAFVGNNAVNWVDPWGLYRSHWLLRLLVPGQIAWDHAVTAAQNGNIGTAALHTTAMLGEQVLVVLTVGQASTLVQQSSQLVSPVCETGSSLLEKLLGANVPIELLRPNPMDEFVTVAPSDRMIAKHLRYIIEHGTIESPILVDKLSDGTYQIINGHHRWAAAIRAGLKKIPVKFLH
jgi:RHS repeat-associated protein